MNQRVSKLIRKIARVNGKKRKDLKRAWNRLPKGTKSIAKLEELLYGMDIG